MNKLKKDYTAKYNKTYLKDWETLKRRFTKKELSNHHGLEDTPRNRELLMVSVHPMIEVGVSRRYLSYYSNDKLHRSDLFQSGFIGALDALDRWFMKTDGEQRKFKKFNDFAYIWIEKHIKLHMNTNAFQVSYNEKDFKNINENMEFINGNDAKKSPVIGETYTETFMDCIESKELTDEMRQTQKEFGDGVKDVLSNILNKNEKKALFIYFGIIKSPRNEIGKLLKVKRGEITESIENIIERVRSNVSDEILEIYLSNSMENVNDINFQ